MENAEIEKSKEKNYDMPFYAKYTLSVEEAAVYFHIGRARLRELANENLNAPYILMIGNRVFIKRKMFEEYIDQVNYI